MIENLLGIVVALLILGVILWGLQAIPWIDPTIKQAIKNPDHRGCRHLLHPGDCRYVWHRCRGHVDAATTLKLKNPPKRVFLVTSGLGPMVSCVTLADLGALPSTAVAACQYQGEPRL